ncbi:MAG: 3-deoxy-8-phosphooctulonate synthase [Opitutales bacterium]|nr:3-deoxy-8-phosphooctulonate synthase [Opitutales bacterium]
MIFDDNRFLLVAGPCSLENESVSCAVAEKLAELQKKYPVLKIVFKGSFDKANRSSIFSERGPGLDEGLRLLSLISERYGLPVTTDIHLPEQADPVAQVCDLLQIPAFLCRQTDLLVAAAHTGCSISVKKGQFLAPHEMKHVVQKLREAGAHEILQVERGTTFGYNNLVVDMRSFDIMKRNNCPVLFDATHSVQLPGAGDGCTIGQREFVAILARAAVAAGVDGLFFEVHPNPEEAICDAANQVSLDKFENILDQCLAIWETCGRVYR